MKNLNFLSNQSDFGLENGSGMTREWLGIDSTVSRKLFTLLFVLLLGFGQMWGAVPTGWSEVTSLSGIAAGDKIIIVTNNGSNYFNGTQSSGHFQVTALSASAPASASAAGVIELVSTGTTNRYKLKLVSTNKYVTASAAKSGSGVVNSSSDDSGWTFSYSSGFNAQYQKSGQQAYCRSYSNNSFRTYANTSSGATFKIYKYSSAVAVTGVSVSPTSKAIVVGEQFTITPTVSPNNASNKNINWSTSNSAKATVSSGTVTGVAAGTANIIATSAADNTKTATCAVTVYSVTVQKQDETGATITADGVSASASGRTLTASATPASHYVFKGWKYGTAAGTSIASTGSASTTLNGTPTGNVTVIAEFYKPISVSWNKNGSLYETTYTGYNQKPVFPSNPSSCDATSNTFYGWATGTWDGPVDNLTGKTVYTSADDMPNVTSAGTTYNAVFAKATGSSTPANFTSTFNSNSWGDSNSLWDSGKAGNQLTSGRGIQITTGVSGANATTKSSYSNVTSVVVTYSTNASSGAGSIAIKVGDTNYTGNASVSTSGGTTDRTITYTGTSNATGKVKITVNCTTNSLYIKSVQVNYSTGGTTYSKYLTTCCTALGSINGSFNRYHLKIFHHIIMSMFISLIF